MKSALKPNTPASSFALQTPTTLHGAAVAELRKRIILGQLKPGMLLKDTEIATQFGLSNTPVREAFVKLAAEGLVEIVPNKYKRVTPIDYQAMVELLLVQNRLWELGYEWGAKNITEKELALLKKATEDQREAMFQSDAQTAVNASHDFHLVLMQASKNKELVRVSVDRLPLIQRFVILCMPWLPTNEMLDIHEKMFLAFKAGKTDSAIILFRQAYNAFLNDVIKLRDSKLN